MRVWHEVTPPPFDDCFHDCLDIYEELAQSNDPPDESCEHYDDYDGGCRAKFGVDFKYGLCPCRGIAHRCPKVVEAECEDDPVMRELLENRSKDWNAHSVRCVDCEYYHALSESVTGCKGICGNELEARKFVYKYSYKMCENYLRRTT